MVRVKKQYYKAIIEDTQPEKKRESSGLDGARRDIHFCTICRYHRLVGMDRVTITGHVTLLAFIVAPDLKDHGPAILLYLINVFEEVPEWLPAVVIVEVRR